MSSPSLPVSTMDVTPFPLPSLAVSVCTPNHFAASSSLKCLIELVKSLTLPDAHFQNSCDFLFAPWRCPGFLSKCFGKQGSQNLLLQEQVIDHLRSSHFSHSVNDMLGSDLTR